MYSSLNIDLLYVFTTVAKTQSISKSSTILSLSQPAISKKIQQLEEHFQAKLFIRSAHGMMLTMTGQTFYQQALKVLHDFDALYATESDQAEPQLECLQIGSLDSIAALLYPHFFSTLPLEKQQLLLTNQTSELIEKFNYGLLDIIFMNDFLENKLTHSYEKHLLRSEPYYVVYAKQNQALQKVANPTLHITDLKDTHFILHPEYSALAPQLEHLFDRALLSRPLIQTVNCFDFISYLISHKSFNSVTILPEFLAKHQQKNALYKELSSKKLALPKPYQVALFSNGKLPLTSLTRKLY